MQVDNNAIRQMPNYNNYNNTSSSEVKQVAEASAEVPTIGEKAVQKLGEELKRKFDSKRQLEFSIHDETKKIMIKVINTDTNEVVREIPSEQILDMVAKFFEINGLFIDEKR